MTEFEAPEPWKFLHTLDKNAEKTAVILDGIVEDMKEVKADQEKTNERVSALEARRWPANTISIVMMILGAIGTVFTLYKAG